MTLILSKICISNFIVFLFTIVLAELLETCNNAKIEKVVGTIGGIAFLTTITSSFLILISYIWGL